MMHDAETMKQYIADTFDRAAPSYDQHGPHFFARFGQRLVELADLSAGARVLDIATGRGAVLFPALNQVGSHGFVQGIDLSAAMVQQTTDELRQRGIQHADVRQMDAENLTFADNTFDYVLCGFALFFLPNLTQALTECWRVLTLGGQLSVTTWGRDDPRWDWFGDLLKAYLPEVKRSPQHGASATTPPLNQPEGLETVLHQAGFTEARVIAEEIELHYADADVWWTTLWSHGIRGYLEQLSPADLARFKADTFAHLRAITDSDGVPQRFAVLYSTGRKPVAS